MKRVDPLWLSMSASRVVTRAEVPYQIARRLLLAGMDEDEAFAWAQAWRRSGKDIDEIIRIWRSQDKRWRPWRRRKE